MASHSLVADITPDYDWHLDRLAENFCWIHVVGMSLLSPVRFLEMKNSDLIWSISHVTHESFHTVGTNLSFTYFSELSWQVKDAAALTPMSCSTMQTKYSIPVVFL